MLAAAALLTGGGRAAGEGTGGLLAIEIEDMLFAIREGDVRWAALLDPLVLV